MARRAMLWAPLAILAALANIASADVQFVSPKAGDKLVGGGSIDIEWKDSGDGTALSDFTTYELFLCAGGNKPDQVIQLAAIRTATAFTTTGNKVAGVVDASVGASTPANAYFLKIISTASKGGTVTNFSPRFSLSGMSGTFSQSVLDGMKTVSGTSGPDTIDTTSDAVADPAEGDYGIDYTMQTGPTRYAPMQPQPPTKITATATNPLHPTSGYTIATTFMGTPNVQTTITQSQTFSVSSKENPAAAAAAPTDDMAKFLARWKD